MGNIIISPPNKARIISGPKGSRIVIGSTGFQIWCIEKTETLSLELMTLDINSVQAETTKGVRVNVSSVAQIKVKALLDEFPDGGGGGGHGGAAVAPVALRRPKHNIPAILLAAQHFLGDREENIRSAIQRTMEGHQRQILGTLTVEEIYKDRAAFAERVREHVMEDLSNMGFQLVSYTVTSIDDTEGYMQSLGATQTALVKREAAEGKAKNEAEARKKVAAYKSGADIAAATAEQEAHVSVNQQKELEAQADRDLAMKKAAFAAQVNAKQAEAEAAGRIERAKQDQDVVKAKTEQNLIEEQIRVRIAETEAQRVQKVKEGTSLADLVEEQNRAKAVKVKAEAEAEKIQALGEAEAAAVRAKGEADALVLHKKAEAFKQYGEAALAQMIVEKLPEIATAVAKPLANTEKMVFVSQDGNAGSMLTGDINRIVSQVPETVQALTGVNLRGIMSKATKAEASL